MVQFDSPPTSSHYLPVDTYSLSFTVSEVISLVPKRLRLAKKGQRPTGDDTTCHKTGYLKNDWHGKRTINDDDD